MAERRADIGRLRVPLEKDERFINKSVLEVNMATLEYYLGEGIKRVDGIYPSDLEQRDISLHSIQCVRGYVLGQSGSEYHFTLGLDHKLQNVNVFCDDTVRNGSDEYLAILKRISSQVGSKIDPATGEGKLVIPLDKKSLIATINGIFNEFNVPDEEKSIVVDYKTA